jgi:U3 small nucleolar RNA-associated protein 21
VKKNKAIAAYYQHTTMGKRIEKPAEDSSDASSDTSVDEEPPQPVSSDEEDAGSAAGPQSSPHLPPSTGHSRFFAPYRTLGILTNGAGFHLIPHDHSGNAMLCLPVGDRFQLLQTDRLNPVMVSQRVPGRGSQEIRATVTDATLSITVAVHQPLYRRQTSKSSSSACSLTLFQRTRPLQRMVLASSQDWQLASLLHLGHVKVPMKGEKQGKLENAVIVAAVLRRVQDQTEDEDEDGVAVVGPDEEEEDSDDEMGGEDDDDKVEEDMPTDNFPNANGLVVIMIASRTTLTLQKRIPLPNIRPYTAMHPSTYLNKIVVGGSNADGTPAMVLVNIRSTKVVHTFQCLSKTEGRVTSLTQSPAVDTVAVGTDAGTVSLVNLRLDRHLFKVQSSKAAVQSVSFRTDSSALQYQIAPMAVGTADGKITVWDLSPPEDDSGKGRTILCEMTDVHMGGVAQLQYLPQEPLLVSTGLSSNAVKMHIFDNPDHTGRVLRQRAGHAAGPPTILRYSHPATGSLMANATDGTDASTSCQILSAGSVDRTLRLFSSARSVLDKEFSQGPGLEKRARELGMTSKLELLLPPVVDIATAQARSRDWGDLVTIHQQHSMAYVWSIKRGAQSGAVLRQPTWNVSARKVPPPASTHATSVTVSACGNFCLVGSKGGKIYKYNVQSGKPRGCYPRQDDDQPKRRKTVAGDVARTIQELEKDSKISNRTANLNKLEMDESERAKVDKARNLKLRLAAHSESVTGLAMDAMNTTLVSVGADCKLILWNFKTHGPHRKSPHILPAPACKLVYVRDSDMAAIALEDYSVIMFDCTSLTVVRRLGVKGARARHTGLITDMAFSPDGRSLYTASMDSTIRMWDVPTNACVDWMSFESAPTSLTVSPTGEFLATTHTKSLGISLWSDRSFYQTIHADGKHLDRPFAMDEPVPLAETWGTEKATGNPSYAMGKEQNGDSETEEPSRKVSPKEAGLVTLSGLPSAHWKNLFHLELVKERNKPAEPPKKPPSAPFFLQWRSGEEIAGAKKEEALESAAKEADETEWASAWSDENDGEAFEAGDAQTDSKRAISLTDSDAIVRKRPKVTRYRSDLATMLSKCFGSTNEAENKYKIATDHIASLGPSAIDVELSSLCAGMHDLEEGLPLLEQACDWLLECCKSCERFEAVNAYLHRFLHLHASVIAGIKDDKLLMLAGDDQESNEVVEGARARLLERLALLRRAQHEVDEKLRNKMQHSLCLLRHFTRMV